MQIWPAGISDDDVDAVRITLELACTTTAVLLAMGTPLAWWLARTSSRWKALVGAVVTLPLVLPPAVLGFYLLVWLGPATPIGRAASALGLGTIPFSFGGLVVGSVVYSLPFVVQPLEAAFESVGPRPLEAAATLGAGPVDRFFTVAVPLAAPGFATATVLGFAHTVGEFGVALLVGGNIPGKTRVLSVALYDHVEGLEYGEAHRLAGWLVAFAVVVLVSLRASRVRPAVA